MKSVRVWICPPTESALTTTNTNQTILYCSLSQIFTWQQVNIFFDQRRSYFCTSPVEGHSDRCNSYRCGVLPVSAFLHHDILHFLISVKRLFLFLYLYHCLKIIFDAKLTIMEKSGVKASKRSIITFKVIMAFA